MPARLKDRYADEIRPALIERFGYSTPMQAPKIEKITVNMGVGDAKTDSRLLQEATTQLARITGQQPSMRRARKSIANFKLREGMAVGVSVTLRGERAYEFLDRLLSIAIPRIRDFRGLSPRSFDGRGNYNMGVKEQIIFPEIDYDKVDQVRGLDIAITTTRADRRGVLRAARGVRDALRERPPRRARRGDQRKLRNRYGQDLIARPPAADPQVQNPRIHALPPLRPAALRVPQVRAVPHLPARARAQRLHPRHDEVVVVIACR